MTRLKQTLGGKTFKQRVLSVVTCFFLFCLCFVILYPFIAKITSVFMSREDLKDPTVWLLPKSPTIENIRNVVRYSDFWEGLGNTAIYALINSVLQVASATIIAYGISHFRFKGRNIVILLIVIVLIIPPQVLYGPMYTKFRFFDVFGILDALGVTTPNLQNSFLPMMLLSGSGLGFKCGLFILIMVQQFNALPKELSEAAKVDGAGVFRTFALINLPQVKASMTSVFLISFAWLWTDTFYTQVLMRNKTMFTGVVNQVSVINEINAVQNSMSGVMMNTALVMMLIPLIVLYLIGQKAFVQGIERSGITG